MSLNYHWLSAFICTQDFRCASPGSTRTFGSVDNNPPPIANDSLLTDMRKHSVRWSFLESSKHLPSSQNTSSWPKKVLASCTARGTAAQWCGPGRTASRAVPIPATPSSSQSCLKWPTKQVFHSIFMFIPSETLKFVALRFILVTCNIVVSEVNLHFLARLFSLHVSSSPLSKGLLEKIAKLVNEKKLDDITDLRDETETRDAHGHRA